MTYNPISIKDNVEYASAIYGCDQSSKYTDPLNNRGNNDSVSAPSAPEGETLRAFIHAHAAYDPKYDNEMFSSNDKNIGKGFGVPIYVSTPAGYLKKYDPSKGSSKTTTIGEGLPRDPKSP